MHFRWLRVFTLVTACCLVLLVQLFTVDPSREQSSNGKERATTAASSVGQRSERRVATIRGRFDHPSRAAMDYLSSEGYVIIANVASASEIHETVSLFWDFMENIELGIKRHDVSTWSSWPGMEQVGIIHEYGVGQARFAWNVRSFPRVKKAFSAIWETDDLISSFDATGAFRPSFGRYAEWKTAPVWFHTDQSPVKQGRHAVQGFVSLFDSDQTTGGLVVLPGSHLRHQNYTNRILDGYDPLQRKMYESRDYVSVPADDPILAAIASRFVSCRAGDLVLWDSRTVHCNTPAVHTPAGARHNRSAEANLTRITPYVCMTPRAHAADKVLQLRREAVRKQQTCTHWPHEFSLSARAHQHGFETNAVHLTPAQEQLV
jgi:hypothetical protein